MQFTTSDVRVRVTELKAFCWIIQIIRQCVELTRLASKQQAAYSFRPPPPPYRPTAKRRLKTPCWGCEASRMGVGTTCNYFWPVVLMFQVFFQVISSRHKQIGIGCMSEVREWDNRLEMSVGFKNGNKPAQRCLILGFSVCPVLLGFTIFLSVLHSLTEVALVAVCQETKIHKYICVFSRRGPTAKQIGCLRVIPVGCTSVAGWG